MAEIDGEISDGSSRKVNGSLAPTPTGERTPTTRERRERAMAEAALTLAEIGELAQSDCLIPLAR